MIRPNLREYADEPEHGDVPPEGALVPAQLLPQVEEERGPHAHPQEDLEDEDGDGEGDEGHEAVVAAAEGGGEGGAEVGQVEKAGDGPAGGGGSKARMTFLEQKSVALGAIHNC